MRNKLFNKKLSTFWGIVSLCVMLNLFVGIQYVAGKSISIDQPLDITPPTPSSEVKKIKEGGGEHLDVMDLYNEAMEHSNSREYDEAIQKLKKVLEKDPNFAEAHLNLGWSYVMKRSNYDIALHETLEAIRLKPDVPISYRNLWWIYKLTDEQDKAIDTLKKIIKLEPKNAINYLNLGDAYLIEKLDLKLAADTFKKGLEIDPNHPFLHRKLGKAYEFQGKFDLAIPEFKKAIELTKMMDAYSYLFLAVCLGKAGKKGEIPPLMKEGYGKVAENVTFSTRWDYVLLRFYSGDVSEEDILKQGANFPIHNCQGMYYAAMKHLWEGDKEKAKSLLEKAKALKVEALAEYEYSRVEIKLMDKEKK